MEQATARMNYLCGANISTENLRKRFKHTVRIYNKVGGTQ
jgi:hypothetical protein